MAKSRTRNQPEWFDCPNCGEKVRVGAKACPHCGSGEETGWQDNPESESGLAGEFTDDFDYEDFLEREFPDPQKRNGAQGNRLAWILLVLALAGFVASTFLLF